MRSGSLLHVATLAAQLEDLLGAGRVSMRTQADIQGVRPRVEARPADLGAPSRRARHGRPGGARGVRGRRRHQAGLGQPAGAVRRAAAASTDLPTYCQVDADDLTMTVSAGTTVAEARAAARAQGRVLPLDAAAARARHGRRGSGDGRPGSSRSRLRRGARRRAGSQGDAGRRHDRHVRRPHHEERRRLRHDQAVRRARSAVWASSPR